MTLFVGTASIEAKLHGNTDLLVDVVFTELRGKTYTGYFPQESESSLPALLQGSVVTAELWQGNVTVVAGAKTLDNPDTLPNSGPPVAAFFAFVTLVAIAILVYLVWVDRRAARAR